MKTAETKKATKAESEAKKTGSCIHVSDNVQRTLASNCPISLQTFVSSHGEALGHDKGTIVLKTPGTYKVKVTLLGVSWVRNNPNRWPLNVQYRTVIRLEANGSPCPGITLSPKDKGKDKLGFYRSGNEHTFESFVTTKTANTKLDVMMEDTSQEQYRDAHTVFEPESGTWASVMVETVG